MTPQEAIGQLRCNVEGDYINLDDLEAFELAISALEKQIPKKPIPLKDNYTGKIVSYGCPDCNNTDLGNNEFKNKYCENCGQALDWSDTE